MRQRVFRRMLAREAGTGASAPAIAAAARRLCQHFAQQLTPLIDWRSRIGQPLDWAAYDRGMARLATGPTQHVLPAGSRARKWSRTRGGDGVSTRPVDG
jgi:hypothetical protein